MTKDDPEGLKQPVGMRIRSLRQERGMSLNALARESGFTKGYLSKLENGHAQAPIATLMSLAKCLDSTVGQILDSHAPKSLLEQESVLTKSAAREFSDADSGRGYQFERLAVGSRFRLSPYIIHLDNDDAPVQSYQHGGEEVIYMLEGSCQYRVGDTVHDLDEGDCLVFDATLLHGPLKLTNIEARYFALFDEH